MSTVFTYFLFLGTNIDLLNSKKPTEVHLEPPPSAIMEEFVEISPKKQTGRKRGSKTIGLSRLKQLNPVSEINKSCVNTQRGNTRILLPFRF